MLYATNIFPGDGSTRQFEITFVGGYLNKSHVKVYVEDAVTKLRSPIDMGTVTWLGPYTIQIPTATSAGSNTVVARETPLTPIVDFQGSSRITEANLDVANRQGLFVATESLDNTNSQVVTELKEAILNSATWAASAEASAETASMQAAIATTQAEVATEKAGEAAGSAEAAASYIGSLAAPTGSSLVGYTGTGVGAVTTTVQEKLREHVSVKDKGAVGDGVTSDQAAIVAAVAVAYSLGSALCWPAGAYVSTANIPHFHDVKHFGEGVIKRGSDTFKIAVRGGQVNTIYVSTSGLDTNDGLSAAEPFLTTQAAGDTLYGWPWNKGTWKVQHAAGTFTQIAQFLSQFPCSERVQFLGATVADGVSPTTVFASPGGTSKIGINVQNKIRAQVQNIKFLNYADTGSPTISGNGSGITADSGCELYCRNVWAGNCDVAIEAASETKLRVQAGVLDANGVGVRCISNVTFTVGYGGTGADITGATGVSIKNSLLSAFFGAEGATGHIDYTYISGVNNTVGIDLYERSRVHLMQSVVAGHGGINGVAVRAAGGCSWRNSTTTPNTFSGNTTLQKLFANSWEVLDDNASFGATLYPVRDPVGATTSSTSFVTVLSKTIPAGTIQNRGSGLDVFIAGEVLGTAGTKQVRVTFGGVVLLTATIAATTAEYLIRCKLVNSTSVAQVICTEVQQNGVLPAINVNQSVVADTSIAQTLLIEHLVTNAADNNRLRIIEVGVVH